MAVVQFARKIPSAFAPILAAAVITIGDAEGVKNHTLLYLHCAVTRSSPSGEGRS